MSDNVLIAIERRPEVIEGDVKQFFRDTTRNVCVQRVRRK